MFERFRKKKPQEPQDETGAEGREPEKAAGKAPAEVLSPFLEAALPDAIDGLAFRVAMGSPDDADPVTGFERYAARLMDEAAASGLRAVAVEHPLEAIRLDANGLFWLRFDESELSDGQLDRALACEAALNRLALVEQAASDGEAPAALTEEACSVADWRIIRSIADRAPSLLGTSAPSNERLSQGDVSAPRGGNWDVLTSLAGRCEAARLPFRLSYRLDADVESGAVAMSLVAPRPTSFPASRWDEEAGRWDDVAAGRPAEAAAYSLRLAVLAAAAALGTSVGISRVVVNVRKGALDGPVTLGCEFERMAFVMGVLPAIDRGDLSGARSFDELLALVAPARVAAKADEKGQLEAVEPLDAGLPERRCPMEEDDRALPEKLATLLRADTVRELDVMSVQDEALAERFDAIMEDSDDAPLLAIAQLEELVATLEEKDRAAQEATGRPLRPLYCQGVFARYLVSLAVDDEACRFFRVSDISYAARSALVRLYLELGEGEAALAQARACVDLAPSSPSSYHSLVLALAAQDGYAEVIDAERQALRLAVVADEIFYAYYRLAYAFWRTGQRDLALACYLRVPPFSSVGEVAITERDELLGEMGGVDLESFDRDAVLRSGGVPLAPTQEALDIMAETAIGFCEASIPLAAGPGASILGNLKHDDALTTVASSLREGA